MKITGYMLHYIKNFLTNRKFQVRCNNRLSELKTQQNGVPEGEILSGTLFLIAINDITSNLPNTVKSSLYADDLVIYIKDRNMNNLAHSLQLAVNKLEEWSKTNDLRFS